MREFKYIFCLVCAFAPCVLWADFLSDGPVAFPPVPVAPVIHDAPVVAFPSSPGNLTAPASFPKTVADLDRDDKIALLTAGYEPYRDMSTYPNLMLEDDMHFLERQMALAEQEREEDLETMNSEEYCEQYPFDEENCDQVPGAWEEFIENINDVPIDNTPPPSGVICTEKTIGGQPVVANNQVVNRSCCAAAKSNYWTNQIYTTTRYDNVAPAFAKGMITVFRKEGTCGLISGDPCGYTCFGIGEAKGCLGGSLGIDVRNLTRPKAEEIYYKHMWQKYKIGTLPDVVSTDVFVGMVGMGPSVLGYFRKFLGLPVKYTAIDETDINAVKNYKGDIHNNWINYRKQALRTLFDNNQKKATDKRYKKSVLTAWMNGMELQRENGCHVVPREPLSR